MGSWMMRMRRAVFSTVAIGRQSREFAEPPKAGFHLRRNRRVVRRRWLEWQPQKCTREAGPPGRLAKDGMLSAPRFRIIEPSFLRHVGKIAYTLTNVHSQGGVT